MGNIERGRNKGTGFESAHQRIGCSARISEWKLSSPTHRVYFTDFGMETILTNAGVVVHRVEDGAALLLVKIVRADTAEHWRRLQFGPCVEAAFSEETKKILPLSDL